MATFVCPGCQALQGQPIPLQRTICSACGEGVVWRRCASKPHSSYAPVLERWKSWTHKGCASKHPVSASPMVVAAYRIGSLGKAQKWMLGVAVLVFLAVSGRVLGLTHAQRPASSSTCSIPGVSGTIHNPNYPGACPDGMVGEQDP
jgi:hypothetical protein